MRWRCAEFLCEVSSSGTSSPSEKAGGSDITDEEMAADNELELGDLEDMALWMGGIPGGILADDDWTEG